MKNTNSDGPLVTFALFAYNQEQYIREAVEGAFSQTYSPLEIILSDDCSSDRTFDIMCEMAREYRGPHLVKVRRGEVNLGLIDHVNRIVTCAKADIIVLAAGGDISLPSRTDKVVAAFLNNPNAVLVHSNVREIHEGGRLGEVAKPPIRDGLNLLSVAISSSIYIGAAGAISRRIYERFGLITEKDTYEDLVFGFRAALLGGLCHLDEDLVLYRKNIGTSSEYRRRVEARSKRRIRQIRRRLSTLQQRQLDAAKVAGVFTGDIDHVISKEMEYASARLDYHTQARKFFGTLLISPRFYRIKAVSSETKYLLRIIE